MSGEGQRVGSRERVGRREGRGGERVGRRESVGMGVGGVKREGEGGGER